MNFRNWEMAKEKAEELNLYTKAYLKERFNRKPIEGVKGEIHRVYTAGRWKEFVFYKIEDTIEIKSKAKNIVEDLEINEQNICEALYVINNSAKISRETKVNSYSEGKHGIVKKAKNRQNKLYNLKSNVIKKAIDKGYIRLEGYQIQDGADGRENILLCYRGINTGFGFHEPTRELNDDIYYLGRIGIIPVKTKMNTKMKFTQAEKLLIRFLDE